MAQKKGPKKLAKILAKILVKNLEQRFRPKFRPNFFTKILAKILANFFAPFFEPYKHFIGQRPFFSAGGVAAGAFFLTKKPTKINFGTILGPFFQNIRAIKNPIGSFHQFFAPISPFPMKNPVL